MSIGNLLRLSMIGLIQRNGGPDIFTNYEKKIYHWLGDPSMDINFSYPIVIDSVSINLIDSPHIFISNPDLDVVLYNKDNGTVKISKGNKIPLDDYTNTNFTICIKGNSVRPVYAEISADGTLYIQNEIICGKRHYRARHIKVGNSISDSIPHGSTIIRNGKVIFEGNTSLEEGTIVEKTADLTICSHN